VLSEHEQMSWDEIEHKYRAEAGEATRGRLWLWTGTGRSGRRADLPAVVVGGGWSTVLLVLFGVPMAGVAVGAATGLIWLLWRFLPQLDDAGTADAERITENVDDRTGAADQRLALPCHRPLRRLPKAAGRTGPSAARRSRPADGRPARSGPALVAGFRQRGPAPSRRRRT
jgi:hypothetical protein